MQKKMYMYYCACICKHSLVHKKILEEKLCKKGEELRKMMGSSESMESTQLTLPKHILDIWAIVLIILGTIVIMTLLVLCPATTVIIYRVWTHPMHHNGAE
ncbi:small integral membrane protein 3 [Pseudonaja textilis]|nr:small integral membrane protein 3 [Pseudonaja textilis]